MKRFLCIFLSVAYVLVLFGCSNTQTNESAVTEPNATNGIETVPPETGTTDPSVVPTVEPTEPPTSPTADVTDPKVPATGDSTTPGTIPSTVPGTTPVTTPVTTPATTPVTIPSTTPGTSPSTAPATPPSTKPVTPPVTKPVTPPGTTPTTQKVTVPTLSAQCAHTWAAWTEKAAATCEKAGVKQCICLKCQETQTAEIAKLDHKESDWIIDKAAATGVEGKKHTECQYCQRTLRTETIPALTVQHTHNAVEAVITKNPTCLEPGSRNIICSCGKVMEVREEPATGHSYTTQVIQPTPYANGYTLHSCANCTDNYKDTYTEFGPTASLKYTSKGDGTCVVSGISDKTIAYVMIPEKSPAGDTVVGIAGEAFKKNNALVYVDIPDTVTNVGYMAFYLCKNLKTVNFPRTGAQPLVLNYDSFAESAIETLDLSQTYIETVANGAFRGCKQLKTVKLNGVQKIDNFAFQSCSALQSVIHTEELTTIGERAFEKCSSLTVFRSQNNAQNLDTIQYLYDGAFSNTAIRNITFRQGLIANGTPFGCCTNLGTVDCSQLSGLGVSFTGSYIEKIYLPQSMTAVGASTFSGVRINELVLPDTVTNIAYNAFNGAQMGKIVFGSGLTKIGNSAFKNAKITTYDFSKVTKPLTIGTEAFANNGFTTFAFPDSTVSIGKGALKGCNSLRTLTIPFIAGDAESSNSSKDCLGWLFDSSVNGIDVWDQDEVVPASLKTLIFRGNDLETRDLMGVKLTDIVIGQSVTSIGADNFQQYESPLQRMYYEGTEAQWSSVVVKSNNQQLLSAKKYFYSETKPTKSGNYWHYDSNGNIAIW